MTPVTEHNNPTAERAACAPYNFIPLPRRVVAAVDDPQKLPDHDAYHSSQNSEYYQLYKNSGQFTVTLETKSPLFIRAGLSREKSGTNLTEWELAEKQKSGSNEKVPFRSLMKNTPKFFHTHDENMPVIPGSSLRGMLRSLLEIVSFGKMDRVSDKKLFFRTVDNTAVGLAYRDRMVGSQAFGNKVEAGFIQRERDNYVICKCEVLRVSRALLLEVLPGGGSDVTAKLYDDRGANGRNPNMYPTWRHQYHQVWVLRAANNRQVEDITSRFQDGYEEGRLVITGNMQSKEREFVFLMPPEDAEKLSVPKAMIESFHDKDQVTLWQQKAFAKDQPVPGNRQRGGWLASDTPEEGQPIFFLRERHEGDTKETLSFFGRAQMFRLPYLKGPKDLIPDFLKNEDTVDYADALFGYVRSKRLGDKKEAGDKAVAYAGRVFVSDAVLNPGQNNLWLSNEAFAPKILGSPQATCFQHYLVQRNTRKDDLNHYDSRGTTIRGHKIFWTQGNVGLQDIKANPLPEPNSTQHTQFKPLAEGKTFTFTVRFENLSDAELGALCWTLQPQGDPDTNYFHKIGMGKPLGMGKAHLTQVKLDITSRPVRYASLFNGEAWATGNESKNVDGFISAFDQEMREKLGVADECDSLAKIKRIAMLLRMMAEPNFKADSMNRRYIGFDDAGAPDFRYMQIQNGKTGNDYRNRPVLPDPSWAYFGNLSATVVEQEHKTTSTSETRPAVTLADLRAQQQVAEKVQQLRDGVFKSQWVSIVRSGKPGKFVVTVEGETAEFSIDIPFKMANRCRCDVTYQKGKPISGKFKGWS